MASGELLKSVFKKADKERLSTFLNLLRSWIAQEGNTQVQRLAFQTFGFYYESQDEPEVTKDVDTLQSNIEDVLAHTKGEDSDWELIYSSLQLATILSEKFPSKFLSKKTTNMWTHVRSALTYPHAWVKLSAAKLVSTLFADIARSNVETGFGELPLKGSNGLTLGADEIRDFIRRSAHAFKTPQITELLATEIVKNLNFLGRVAAASNLMWKAPHSEEDDVSDDEEDVAAGPLAPASKEKKQSALNYIFGRISFILRREATPPRAPVLIPKTAALQLLTMLCGKLDADVLAPSLQAILLPLHNLTDPSIPVPYTTDELFKSSYQTLQEDSRELMEVVKSKVGTSVYTEQLLEVRKGVKERRMARSSKRKIEVVTNPEMAGREKVKRVERKKERRKEKGAEHRDQRRGY
jgi:U3 small nucleolar RNA-associated protein 20